MKKQRLMELAGVVINEKDDLHNKIGIVMRYAQENWENDVWMDATYELLHALAKADPTTAREWVEGNLDDVEVDEYSRQQDQSGRPVGNQTDW